MATCLGIYINRNIIKYAKVTREKDSFKVDAFGVKIYSNLIETINQIISETYSFKIPISINISEEVYNIFYMSNLLNKNDLSKAISTEFESYCYDKGVNSKTLESRYIIVNDANEKEKLRIIHVSVDKIKLNKIIENFETTKLSSVTPISFDIANVLKLENSENVAIVNIEDNTVVTIITGNKIYDIKNINTGSSEILDNINNKENSYAKAYEICKNTTIYTMQGNELQDDKNEYLSEIVPSLYKIANELNEIITNSLIKINKVYITGTASVINNIDLYFEEILKNVKCEILKPFFIENSPKINIKDYIEVNSALALALQGLDYGIKNISFVKSKNNIFEGLFSKSENKSNPSKNKIIEKLNNINISNAKLSKWLITAFSIALFTFIVYGVASTFINNNIQNKIAQVANISANTNKQISSAKKDKSSVDSKTSEYTTLTKNLQDATSLVNEKNSYKNTIPVLLSQITTIIPKQVQITSIENPTDKKIVIIAQSEKYEQLAYFKAKLKSEGILNPSSIVSSEAVKDGSNVKIQIEGDLP